MHNMKQNGFSILELMIALLLGLVVIAGIVQLFVGNSRTYELVTGQSRMQESARYSFEFMSEAARNAGFFGCAPEPEFIINGMVGAGNNIPEYNIGEPVGGFEANGDGTFGPTNLLSLPRSEGGSDLNVHFAGNGVDGTVLDPNSDILIFRSVRQPVARLNDTLQPDGDPEVFTPGGVPAYNINDVVVISDCEQAAMIKVTGVSVSVDRTTLSRTTGGGNFDNTTAPRTLTGELLPPATPPTLSVLGRSYGVSATVGLLETTIFFIAPSTQANEAGDNINSLWRKQGPDAPVELVQGVEAMQVFYGVDTTTDNIPNVNRYLPFDQVGANSVVAVRVRLDVTSPDELAEVGDRLRRTFTKTISVRNAGV